jgi:hypothetical protein
MDEPTLPASIEELISQLTTLQLDRNQRHSNERISRRSLSKSDRARVLEKTTKRCHICGGPIDLRWQADHVLAHSNGGQHSVENFLPAHNLCNNYRWDYSQEEFQWILKLGVWVRTQIVKRTLLGRQLAEHFFAYEVRRQARRRKA